MRRVHIGQYQLQRVLGRGAFGEVWLAHDEKLNRKVAIKRLKPEVLGNAVARRRFDSEAEILISISEPHVVHVLDRIEIEGVPALVTEYMEGGSIEDRRKARQEPFTVEEVGRWAEQAALGLAAMHRRGILHRDIKPANLFLSHDGNLSIGDFGLAREVDKTQTLGLQGTMPYMSPEQIKGVELDARTDLFSLGVALYEMLTGKRPFGDGFDRSGHAASVSSQRREVPQALSDVIDGLLVVDVEKRIQTADELLLRLKGQGAQRSIPLPSARRVAIGLLILAAVAAGGYFGRCWIPGVECEGCQLGQVGERRVAILPFDYRGSDEFERIAEEIPMLVAARLNGTGGITAPTPEAWSRCSIDPALISTSDQRIRDWTDEHEVRLVVHGVVSEVHGRLRIDLSFRYWGNAGERRTKSSITLEQASEALPAVNNVGLEVLRQLLVEPSDDLAEEVLAHSSSFEAVCEFVNGFYLLRKGRFNRAATMERAVALDSTMALGYYGLAGFAEWMESGSNTVRRYLEEAMSHKQNLDTYGLQLVESALLENRQDVAGAERLLVDAIRASADRPTAWLRLANIQYQHNLARGRSWTESRRSFERVQQVDPGNVLPGLFLQFVWAGDGDDTQLRQLWGTPPMPPGPTILAFTGGSQAARDSILEATDWCGKGFAYRDLMILAYPDNHRNIIEYVENHVCEENRPADVAWIGLTLAAVNAGMGRVERANSWFDQVPEEFRAFRLEYESLALSLPFIRVSDEKIHAMIAELDAWEPSSEPVSVDPQQFGLITIRFNPHIGVHEHLRLYCLASLHARLGDAPAARAAITRLGQTPVEESAASFVSDLGAMAEARIDLSKGDYRAALDHLDDVLQARYTIRGGYSSFFQRADSRYLRGLCLLESGEYSEAIGWFDASTSNIEFQLIFSGFARLRQAEAYEAMGELARAHEHYLKFLELFSDADAVYDREVEHARERVSALGEASPASTGR